MNLNTIFNFTDNPDNRQEHSFVFLEFKKTSLLNAHLFKIFERASFEVVVLTLILFLHMAQGIFKLITCIPIFTIEFPHFNLT